MGRNRAIAMTVSAVCIVALVGVGLRYVLIRNDRRATEQTVVQLTRRANDAHELLRKVSRTRASADRRNAETRAERDRVRAVGALLHADLDRTRAETTTSAVGAFASGAQANDLAACLVGVSQALNQLSVGDGRAISSLQRVDAECRRTGR